MKHIGLIVERHWHYGRRLCEGIAACSREDGGVALEFVDPDELPDAKRLRRHDGFIARVWDDSIAEPLRRSGRPVIDIYAGDSRPGFAVADQDSTLIGHLAAHHFIERRFTRFAFCGYSRQRFSVLLREAFAKALEDESFGCDAFEDDTVTAEAFWRKIIQKGSVDLGANRTALARWVRELEKPVGVFCAHDLVALDLVKVCAKAGIAVPEDVAVLGVDNDPLLCDFTNPTISSIDPNAFEVGRVALGNLLRWIETGQRPDDAFSAPAGLVARTSTDAFVTSARWLSDALAFIRRNVSRNINAAEVIASTGRSHTTVEKAFRDELGTSVRREIARVRMAEARRLLRDGRLPISEVAKRSGFSSTVYFTAAFSAAEGIPPLAFRNRERRE